jgi:hypothetical protein
MNTDQLNTVAQCFSAGFAHIWAMLCVVLFSQGHWICGAVSLIASVIMALA